MTRSNSAPVSPLMKRIASVSWLGPSDPSRPSSAGSRENRTTVGAGGVDAAVVGVSAARNPVDGGTDDHGGGGGGHRGPGNGGPSRPRDGARGGRRCRGRRRPWRGDRRAGGGGRLPRRTVPSAAIALPATVAAAKMATAPAATNQLTRMRNSLARAPTQCSSWTGGRSIARSSPAHPARHFAP